MTTPIRLLAAIALVSANPASATSVREFRKFSTEQQGLFISGAISMLAYSYAVNGDVARASCLKNWYFESKSDGPATKLALEISIVERRDADRFHIEGVIMGVAEKVCPATSKAK